MEYEGGTDFNISLKYVTDSEIDELVPTGK